MSRLTAHKGQMSMELIPFVALGLALLIVFVGVMAGRLNSVQNSSEQEALGQVAELLENEIRIAATVQDGYERNFTLPKKIINKHYDIQILASNTISVNTSSFEASKVTHQVIGQPVKGTNTITKAGGQIALN
jgi:hypothetical protein